MAYWFFEEFERENLGLLIQIAKRYRLEYPEAKYEAMEAFERALKTYRTDRPEAGKYRFETHVIQHYKSLLRSKTKKKNKEIPLSALVLDDEERGAEERFLGRGNAIEFMDPIEMVERENAMNRIYERFLKIIKKGKIPEDKGLQIVCMVREGVPKETIEKKLKVSKDIIREIDDFLRRAKEEVLNVQ